MPILNCQQQFEQPILDDIKTSTIRKKRKDGCPPCKAGDDLKLYVGLRTKACRLIATVRVISVKPIKIIDAYWHQPLKNLPTGIFIDDEEIDYFTKDGMSIDLFKLAHMEGFKIPKNMCDWFIKHHQIDQQPFTGWHIQWEALS